MSDKREIREDAVVVVPIDMFRAEALATTEDEAAA